jgi:DNA-binding MarR family transcriptional regulator
VTISTLAERLGVTQQAASKSVVDLEKRGYLSREPDPADARARQVVLSARGEAVIAVAPRHRAALDSELRQALGDDRVEAARTLLVDAIKLLGAAPALRARAARPPR